MTQRSTNNRGLSMIEMMFAMLILFMVGVFVMDMFVGGSRQMVKASKSEKLNSLLRAKVSEWRVMNFGALATAPKNGPFDPPDDDYSYSVSLSDFEDKDPDDVQIVTVTVQEPETGRQMTSRMMRSRAPDIHPGQEAFDKFGCASCHSVPSAGYPDYDYFVPLDSIGDAGNTRPYQGPSPTMTFNEYIVDSLLNPNDFEAFPVEETLGPMLQFKFEDHDPDFDPAYDVSAQELEDMAEWIESLNSGP